MSKDDDGDAARAAVEAQSGAAAAASRCRRFKVKERRLTMPQIGRLPP